MYKLVAIDLDGTMLNSHGIVTQRTKNAIKRAKENGSEVIIASGRPIDSIKTIAKEIESKKYFIAGNGAIVYDIKKDEIIYNNFLKKDKILEIIKICEENSISYNVYTDRTILAKALKYNVLYYHKENLKKEENKKTSISIIKNMYEYVKDMKEENFLKMTICDDNKFIFNSIIKKIKNIQGIDILEVSHMSRKTIKQGTEEVPVEYYYTEITAENVDKWTALEFLLSKINIKKEELIAIGDNINDEQMIEHAGLGVAMKGSTPVITKKAQIIAETNDDDGVAKILEEYT